MVSLDTFRKLALSFPEATEEAHFEKASFRVHKKIFATYDLLNHRACLSLTLAEQDLFCLADKSIIYPVDNKWGKQGWTYIDLHKVKKQVLADALNAAYNKVAPAKLANEARAKDKK